MYQLVSAVGIGRTPGSRWQPLEIGNMPMSQLYMNYENVQVVLTNNFVTGQLGLDMSEIKAANLDNDRTFNEFLSDIGNASLPTTNKRYLFETHFAIYSDAFRARYKVTPVSPNGHPDSPIPMSERDWVALTKPDIDYNLFYKSCMVSVNGYYHLTDTDGLRAYVVDAMKSCRHSGRNQIGITSFRTVGELEFLPITEAMIHKRYADVPYSDTAYLDIGMNRGNKTAMLVLGGYLHVLDDRSFQRISESIFAINFRNLPWRDRYFESVDSIDLSSLELEHTPQNEYEVSDAQLHSDEVLVKLMTLSQSFLVFVDCENLFVERDVLRRSVTPRQYTSYVEPIYPLVTGVGKISDYWRVKEDNKWSLTVSDGVRGNYLFNTTLQDNITCVDNARDPSNPTELSRAHFLKIGTDVRVETGV